MRFKVQRLNASNIPCIRSAPERASLGSTASPRLRPPKFGTVQREHLKDTGSPRSDLRRLSSRRQRGSGKDFFLASELDRSTRRLWMSPERRKAPGPGRC